MMVNFIGLGAQKSGTSWVYACLYEHPQVCTPIKEIHFFSRDRFAEGKEWYESHFKKCDPTKLKGEFSTSYLYSKEAPGRIKEMYPEAKLIVILRNPIERAYSQYRNAIKAGEIPESASFEHYLDREPSALEQGLYAVQLKRYFQHFNRDQILILIHEDSKKKPQEFIQTIYRFLNIDETYVPSMLHTKINIARTPKRIWIERVMHQTAELLRKSGLDKIVHIIRKGGIPDWIRFLNTKPSAKDNESLEYSPEMKSYFEADTVELSSLLSRDVAGEWHLRV